MKHLAMLVALALLPSCGGGGGSGGSGPTPSAPGVTVVFAQSRLDSLAGIVQSAGKADIVSFDNLNRSVVRIYHLAPGVLWNQPTAQSLTALTTVMPSGDISAQQVSVDPQRADATAIQIDGAQMAFVNNAETTARVEPLIAPVTYEHRWGLDVAPFPWRDNASVNLSLNLKVPTVRLAAGNVGYAQTVLLLRDAVSGKFIFHVESLFDSRPDAPQVVQIDGCQECSGLLIVGGPLLNSGSFVSVCPGSAAFTSIAFSEHRRFAYAVSAEQWAAVIARLKHDFPGQSAMLSDRPADYQLFEVAVLNEIAHAASGAALLATVFDSLTVSIGRACG
jgi:hypothetical protein